MSTSLKEQLLRYTVPQSSAIVRTKKRASFLFNPKEAAEITRDTFYQIGRDGFEELQKKNQLFTQFENNLFNETSIRFERSVQDAAANKKLDKIIRKFFILLSPYFTLSCAHKALEWLINRYSVHEYNRNDLLMLVLPYHETYLFVRGIQVMVIKDNDSFTWLKTLQKNGVHLAKTTLYNHAATNTSFLKDISDFVVAATKIHETPHVLSTLFNFYCMTFTGALEYADKVDDAHVTQMIGALLRGLKSPIINFCAGSYIITAKLLSKTTLSEKLLNKFVENITEVTAKTLYSDALLLLVVLYQSQTDFTEVSEVAVSNIVRHSWIPKMLQQLSEAGNVITSFLSPLFQAAIKYAIVEEDETAVKDFVHELLNVVSLSDDFVTVLINTILNVYKPNNKNTSDEAHAWMKTVIASIEKKYPNIFDREVNRVLKIVPGETMTKHQKRFQKLISNSVSLQNNAEMLQQLYHPVPSIRKQTIKSLMKNYKGMKEREQIFLKEAILDRLSDENPDVVKEALNCSKKIILELVDKNLLKGILIQLLAKCQKDKENWWVISKSVLGILCSISESGDMLVFLSILPFLLPTDEFELKVSKSVVESKFFQNCNVFKGVVDTLGFIDNSENFISEILGSINKNPMDVKILIDTLKTFDIEARDTLHMYLAGLLLCTSLPENCPTDISILILDILINFVNTSKLVPLKKFRSISSCVIFARQNKFPLQGILQFIEILVTKSEKPDLSTFDFGNTNSVTKFYTTILKMLLTGCNFNKDKVSHLYTGVLKFVLDSFNLNFESKINLFLNVSIANSADVDSILQLRCLKIVHSLLERNKNYSEFFDTKNKFIPYVLICLENECKEIRKCAFEIIEILTKNTPNNNGNYAFVLNKLLSYKDEVLLDKNQISVVMNNIIEVNNASIKTVVNSLVQLLSENTQPMYAKIGIGRLLLNANNNEIHDKLGEICFQVLNPNKSKLDRLESEFISNTLDKIYSAKNVESPLVKFFTAAIRNDLCVLCHQNETSVLSAIALNKIDKDNFELFPEDLKQLILNEIIEIATSSQNTEVLTGANKIFKHIDLDSKLVLEYLIKMRDVRSPKITETKRKRRISIVPTVDILDTSEWKNGITVLECIQDKKKIRNSGSLLPVLFDILNKCLDFDEQGNVEYPKQLILSSILNSCHRMDGNEVLPKNTFNVQLIVKCIRASQNPQTHHDALLLLAHTAHLIPSQVLHHIMTIFTFMGSSVLRHDDAYSFQIINKIVDTIIPIFVANDSKENIASILRVFVDSILDVPEHRRMALYKNLLEKTGVDDNLHVFLLLMFEAHVTHSSMEKSVKQSRNIAVPKRLDIAADVARLFPPGIVIANCTKLIKYLATLPEDKEDLSDSPINVLINVKHQTPKQYRHYKYIILTFTSNLLSSKEFVGKIAGLPDDTLIELEPLHKEMIINVLTYIQAVSKTSDRNNNTSLAQYWKVMLHHSYEVLDSVNALLTPQMFLLVIRGLSTHSLLTIRRRSLELLNSKLQHDAGFFQNCSETELHAMLPSLINIIKQIEESVNSEQELIIQTALLSLKLFVKLLIKNNEEKFVSVLDFITNIIVSGKAVDNILASTILCLAELCSQLRAHAISNLGKYMPALLKLLKVHKHKDLPDLLLLSTITAIQKIIESLPLFLSPYLQKLLFELSRITARWGNETNPKIQPFLSKLNNIKLRLGTTIPARVLIPAIEESYKKLIATNSYNSIGPLLDILTEKLKNIENNDIQTNLSELTSFFMNALQFRADKLASLAETNDAEKHVVNALVTLILKLSESSFRPLYYKIYDWAERSDVKTERIITFYALSGNVANSLKGLFVLFAGHFINNAASILDACNVLKQKETYFGDDEKTILLLDYVLETLHAVFLYDNQRFINKERFDVLMQPLVDQLENTLGGGDCFIKRANNLLIPSIVQFAVASGDDTLWKQLNYQILLKMRNTSVNIRLTALKCVLEFSRKLGEDFLPLLPETIPFLAELLEDEEEDVEKTCQKTVQEMEKILGEPLQKYF